MDTDKWQSVATVRALIAELRQINQHLESLREEIKKQSETIRTAYEREEDQRNIQPVWLNPILTKYEEFEGKRKTDGEQHYRVQNNLRWATWAAFFAAAVYAFLTYRAVNVAENSNSLIQKTMRVSQSPYLHDDGSATLRPLSVNQRPTVDMTFKNFGKLTAEQFAVAASFEVTKEPAATVDLPGPPPRVGDVPPDTPVPISFTAPFVLSPTQAKDIAHGVQRLYLYSVFQYHNPLDERGMIILGTTCYEYDPQRPDRRLMTCAKNPRLLIKGKERSSPYEPQSGEK